jgi:hypothetical protein
MLPDRQPLSFRMEKLVLLKVKLQEELISNEYFPDLFGLNRDDLNCKAMNLKKKSLKFIDLLKSIF